MRRESSGRYEMICTGVETEVARAGNCARQRMCRMTGYASVTRAAFAIRDASRAFARTGRCAGRRGARVLTRCDLLGEAEA